jgi:hypothetical protein
MRSAPAMSAITGALAWLARPALSQTAREIEEAAAQSVADLGLQTELPGQPSAWVLPLWRLPSINVPELALWLALAAAFAFILYQFRDYLPKFVFGRSTPWTSDEAAGADPLARPAQASTTADELAAQGRYVEAMHVLLVRAIAELRERLGVNFADSLTSREILRRANLPEGGRASFRDIITRVELSHFGAYPADAQDYGACRRSYDALMELLYAAPGAPGPSRAGP